MTTLPTKTHLPHAPGKGICGATTLVGKLGYGVTQHTDGTFIVQASQGGVGWPLITEGAVGEPIAFATPGQIALVYVDGTSISYGTFLTCEAAGRYELAATGDYVTAIALEAATAAGDFIWALVCGPFIAA